MGNLALFLLYFVFCILYFVFSILYFDWLISRRNRRLVTREPTMGNLALFLFRATTLVNVSGQIL